MNDFFDEQEIDDLERIAELSLKKGDKKTALMAMRKIDSISQGAIRKAMESKQKSNSALEAIGNIALEGMAAVNRGAAGIVDFAATPINAALELAGSETRIPSAVQALAPATQGNFMQPGLGRDVVRSAGEAVPSALAVGAGLRSAAGQLPAMASGSESIGAGALRQLGQSTPAADAGYAALSGAGSEIGQAVGGEPGALVGAIAAPAAAATVVNAPSIFRSFFTGGDPSVVAKNIDDFASFGETPTTGMATGSTGVQAFENVSSKAIGGAPLARKSEKIAESMRNRLSQIADDISLKEGAETAGLEIKKGITGRGGFLDRFRTKSSALWNEFDSKVSPDQAVTPNNTFEALDRLVRGGEVGQLLDNPKLVQMRQVLSEANNLTYKDLRDLRSSIGQKIANNELISDIPRAELKQIYGALSEDIKSVAETTGDEAIQAFRRANTFTRVGHNRVDDYLERIVNKVEPEKIFQAITKGGEGTKTINAFKRSLKPDEWEVVVSNVVRRLGRATSGQQNAVGDDATGDAFSIAKFVTDWDRLGPARKSIFSGSEKIDKYGEDLNRIARAASTIKESAKAAANASGTAQAGSRIAAGTGLASGVALADPTILTMTGASIAMNNMGARLMSNPKFVSWLAKSSKIPASKSSPAIAQLSAVANQSGADDAAVIQQLVEELESQE